MTFNSDLQASSTLHEPETTGSRQQLVGWAAFVWGLATCMPVGLGYAAMGLLLLGICIQWSWPERWQRFRAHAVFWPAVIWMTWCVLIWATQPRYAETSSNMVHAARIALTLMLGLSLRLHEVRLALWGMGLSVLWAVALIAINQATALPTNNWWEAVILYQGNKSIGIALQIGLFAACAVVLGISMVRKWQALAAVVVMICLAAIVTGLPSRTSLLVAFGGAMLALTHRWRDQWSKLGVGLVAVTAVLTIALAFAPGFKARFAKGVQEVQLAHTEGRADMSWAVRYHMYKTTWEMTADKPLLGWGMGAWNDQWKARTAPHLHKFNMPHNDFLWMSSQAGILGALTLAAWLLMLLVVAWRKRGLGGQLAVIAAITLILALSVNSALRDAKIGLSLLFTAACLIRLAGVDAVLWLPERVQKLLRPSNNH
jgi:O-antigen ligase